MDSSLLFSEHALSGLSARLGQQGRGGGLAARGEICMQGATNLVGEAAEAPLAGLLRGPKGHAVCMLDSKNHYAREA